MQIYENIGPQKYI